MYLIESIKEKADLNYKSYENNIIIYYNSKTLFGACSLSNYIYKFYIQSDYYSAHKNNVETISNINTYIQNLYQVYYNHYTKNKYIAVSCDIIDKLLLEDNSIDYLSVQFIVNKTGFDKNIEDFLKISFETCKQLPKFALWKANKNNAYVFLAKLLEFCCFVK